MIYQSRQTAFIMRYLTDAPTMGKGIGHTLIEKSNILL